MQVVKLLISHTIIPQAGIADNQLNLWYYIGTSL